jgi:O-antigen ligase
MTRAMLPYAMSKLNKFLSVTLGLYVIGILASMAVISATEILLTITSLVLWILHWKKTKSPVGFWPKLGPDIWLWLYFGIVILGALIIPEIPSGHDRWEVASSPKWILYLYGITFAFQQTRIPLKKILRFIVGVTIPICSLAIAMSLTVGSFIREPNPAYHLPGYSFWRAEGFFSNPLTFAYSMGMLFLGLLPFYLYGIFKEEKWMNKLLPITLALILICVYLTLSRGAWLSLVIITAPVLLLWNSKKSFRVFAGILIVFSILFMASPTLRKRIDSFQDPAAHHIRYNIWQANWMMFKDHPLLGVGSERNSKHMVDYADKNFGGDLMLTNAHNNYLQELAGTGIFGFGFWLITMIYFLLISIRGFWNSTDPAIRALHLGSFGAQAVFHFGGFTQGTFVDAEVLMMFCFWIAIGVSAPFIKQSTTHG